MNQFILPFLVIAALLSGCTTNYYLVVSDNDTAIYPTVDSYRAEATVSSGKAFVYTGRSKRKKMQYGLLKGYSSYSTTWRKLAKLNKNQIDSLIFTDDYGYTYRGISTFLYSTDLSRSKSSKSTSSGGSVHVKGYTRKDGTYVRPHTRSAPRRR